jgi:nucleosome binding factor SPN SPT16 subunit
MHAVEAWGRRETERREKENLVSIEDLITAKGRVEALPDVMVRPSPDSKKVLGSVELHENGLRYRSAKGSRIGMCVCVYR